MASKAAISARGATSNLWDDSLSGFPSVIDRHDFLVGQTHSPGYMTRHDLTRCWICPPGQRKQSVDILIGLCKDHDEELREESR